MERNKYNIKGDKAEVFYTDILKENKFPEFEGEKFLTESLLWNRIASKGYKLRWFQDIIYIGEYLDDGLTKSGLKKFKNSPQGLLVYTKEYIKFAKVNLIKRLLQYENYSNAIYDNENIKKAAEDLSITVTTLRCGIILRKLVNLLK